MELTGKCRKSFEKWYIITYFKHLTPLSIQEHCAILECFDDCFESMQYGVYVDFFWFNKIPIAHDWIPIILKEISLEDYRTSAIEKANELHNEFLNK